jgi:imidazolonepropionase-like amidohydrolase
LVLFLQKKNKLYSGASPENAAMRDRPFIAPDALLVEFPMRHVGLVFGLLAASAQAAPSGALHCGRLLDVQTGTLLPDQLIDFKDGLITAVQPAATAAAPTLATATDLTRLTCLPGLIDVHVHLTIDPGESGYAGLGTSVPAATLHGVRNARVTLLAGFTTARNVGADGFEDVALRDAIAAGDIDGPRLQVSGPPLSITGGHGDDNLLPWEYHVTAQGVADGPWAARTKVRENDKFGVDLIKIMASGGVLSKGDQPGAEQFTLEEMQAIVDEAHRAGRKVAAHAHGTQAIDDAIRAGVDSVEHASLIDDAGIALAKSRGTYLVFDIYNDDYILSRGAAAGMLPESIEKEKKLGRLQRESFRRAHQAGAPIAFGTDAGVYPHGDNAKQFATMVAWGMTPIEAIRAATLEAAKLMGWSGKVGDVAPGAYADVIAVPGDPLADIRTLQQVRFVMQGGSVKRPAS